MKKLLIILLVMSALPLMAEDITGRDIMLKVDDNDASETSVMDIAMVIKRGKQQLIRKMINHRKKYGADEKTLIKFEQPADVRNTMYLTWSYEDIEREDDMWMYLPAESLVRRISGGGKKRCFYAF